MGLDILDFTFLLEKGQRLRVRKSAGEVLAREGETVKSLCAKRWDIQAGRFFVIIRDHSDALCGKCKYHPLPASRGVCPSCGEAYEREVLTWDELKDVLARVVGGDAKTITEETWLYRDLGFN